MTAPVGLLKNLENQKITRNHCSKIFFYLIFIISIVSQGKFDPTPFNLMVPPDGINNFFGLPGALLGGFLNDFFGLSAILLPILFIVIKKAEQSNTRFIGLKILLFYLMFNCSLSTISSLISPSIAENFGILGLSAYQFIASTLNLSIGIPILVFFTLMYFYVNANDLEIDWMIFYLFIIAIIAIAKSAEYVWVHAIKIAMKLIRKMTKGISNHSGLIINKIDRLYQNQKKYITQQVNLIPLKVKTKPQKTGTTPLKKRSVSPKNKVSLKFQSKTKQLLHQAIEVYQKTNYPGNDTTIKTLDN